MVFVRAQSLVLTALQLLHDTQTDLLTDLLIEVTGLPLYPNVFALFSKS